MAEPQPSGPMPSLDSEAAASISGVTPSFTRIVIGISMELLAGRMSITLVSATISNRSSLGTLMRTSSAWIRPWLDTLIVMVDVTPGSTTGILSASTVMTGTGTSVSKVDSSLIW